MARFQGKDRKKTTTKERGYDLEQFIEEAESVNSPWPELSDDAIKLTEVDRVEKQDNPGDLVKIATWTMAGVLGAVTIYAIATSNEKLLMTLLGVAAVFLARLTRRGAKNDRTETGARDHHPDDG